MLNSSRLTNTPISLSLSESIKESGARGGTVEKAALAGVSSCDAIEAVPERGVDCGLATATP